MPYCSNCGAHTGRDDKFCFKCGTPAKQPSFAEMASDPKNLCILICFIVSIVLLLLFLSASRSAHHKQDPGRLTNIPDSVQQLKNPAASQPDYTLAAGRQTPPQSPVPAQDSTQKPITINREFEKNLKNAEYHIDNAYYSCTDGVCPQGVRIEKIYYGDINGDGIDDAAVQLECHKNPVLCFMFNDEHNVPVPVGSFTVTGAGEVITNVLFNIFAHDKSRTITRINTLKVGPDDAFDRPTKIHSYYYDYVNDSLFMVQE